MGRRKHRKYSSSYAAPRKRYSKLSLALAALRQGKHHLVFGLIVLPRYPDKQHLFEAAGSCFAAIVESCSISRGRS